LNLVDYVVRKVLFGPVFTPYGWMVTCEVEDIGGTKVRQIFKGTEDEIKEVQVGYIGQY